MIKIISAIVVVLALAGGGYWYMQNMATPAMNDQMPDGMSDATMQPIVETPSGATTTSAQSANVKEFTMTAYYDDKGVWYSLKNIDVKKGDTVRIKATNTKGMHDFSLDEFGIKKELPLDQEVVIEFVADKAGEFQYYCSKPGHRAKGQWGTLNVTE